MHTLLSLPAVLYSSGDYALLHAARVTPGVAAGSCLLLRYRFLDTSSRLKRFRVLSTSV